MLPSFYGRMAVPSPMPKAVPSPAEDAVARGLPGPCSFFPYGALVSGLGSPRYSPGLAMVVRGARVRQLGSGDFCLSHRQACPAASGLRRPVGATLAVRPRRAAW